MNDWPADPRLDASLRRLVDSELANAQIDGAQLIAARNAAPARSFAHSAPNLFGLAGVGLATVVVIVAALALRGTIKTTGGGPGPGGEPSASASIAAASTSPELTAQPSATTSGVPVAGAGRWATTGSPSGATTSFNSALRLADGRVLFIEFPSSEIYDPATGKFTATGGPAVDHSGGSATLLADGRVLLAGGMDTSSGLAKNIAVAEIYDPATGKFGPTGSMVTARFGHTATLLADGRVLIAGGGIEHVDGSGTRRVGPTLPTRAGTATMSLIDSAELYDPGTGKFSPTGSMSVGRDTAAAVRLEDGRVLITGSGDEGNQADASADLYDPATAKFTPTGSMSAARYGHTATLLTDGRVLIASGNNGTNGETSIEIYDPATGRFGDAGSSGNREFYSVASLQSGRLLFIGGFDVANITKDPGSFPSTCDLYDPATHKVSPAASLRGGQYAAAVALLDGRVLVAGTGWAELYTP
jgi:hypothetical protein